MFTLEVLLVIWLQIYSAKKPFVEAKVIFLEAKVIFLELTVIHFWVSRKKGADRKQLESTLRIKFSVKCVLSLHPVIH